MPPVKVTWHDGDRRPKQFADGKLPKWGDGTLFVGEKGMILADYGRKLVLPEADFTGVDGDHSIPNRSAITRNGSKRSNPADNNVPI